MVKVKKNKKVVLNNLQLAQVEALAAYLTIKGVAHHLDISPSTFHEIKNRQPEVLGAYNKGVAKACGYAAAELMGFIKEKKNTPSKLAAIIFYLTHKGGWVKTQEFNMTTKDVTPGSVQIILKVNEKPNEKLQDRSDH